MSVLDIGSGTGFPLLELAMRFGNSCWIYGLDPWEAAVDRIRFKIRAYGITNTELFVAKAEKIPLKDQSIDLITSNNGLNNVEDLQNVLSECFRVLKPGGKLIFTMNTEGTMIEFYKVMEDVLLAHGLGSSVDLMKKHIYLKRRPVAEIKLNLTTEGFNEINTEYDEFSYTFTDATTLFSHFFFRLAFLDAWKKIIPEEIREEIFKEIEVRLDQMAAKRGYIQLSIPFVLIDAKKMLSHP